MDGINCSKCGKETAINQLYCQNCGAKIDYSEFRPADPDKGGKIRTGRDREGKGSKFSILSLIRVVVFLLVLGALGLLVWPVEASGLVGNHDNALECERKVLQLKHALDRKQQQMVTLTEPEVNGFLVEMVKETIEKGGGTGGHLNIETINFRFTAKYVTAVILAGVGPIKFSYELVLAIKPGGGLAEAEIVQARFGHLKLPGGLKDWMAGRIQHIFANRPREQFIIENSMITGLSDRKIIVTTAPR